MNAGTVSLAVVSIAGPRLMGGPHRYEGTREVSKNVLTLSGAPSASRCRDRKRMRRRP